MPQAFFRYLSAATLLAACVGLFAAQQPSSGKSGGPDLTEYRTAEKAITATLTKAPADSTWTGYLGAAVARDMQGRLVVEEVQTDSPADKAGVKKGDVVLQIGDHAVSTPLAFREWLQSYPAGETIKLQLRRGKDAVEVSATLGAVSRPMGKGPQPGGGKKGPTLTLWQKPVLRLAVVPIEFSDIKHNDKALAKDWHEAFFSKDTHTGKKNATGQAALGSLNDYCVEQSYGKFHLEGNVLDWVDVGKKRGDYSQGLGTNNKTAVLMDALAKVSARDGKDAFKEIDGFVFLYAGERMKTNRGAVYYPHAGAVVHDGKRYPYLFNAEGGGKMSAVNTFSKLVALMMGLPDLAAVPEDTASRGLGVWCALSNPITEGRPQHLSAWAKEKLGWIEPIVIDPTVKQKLILAPIEDSPKECLKILVRPNGSEYYLVENRRKKGFDADLPGEGLLIWRVLNDRPTLIESHGVDSPSGPLMYLANVPFPSDANPSFTPDTTPSSRSPNGGGLTVHLTEIRRLGDGRIALSVGYEFR
jgi:M6 family metalloprotease-like protein